MKGKLEGLTCRVSYFRFPYTAKLAVDGETNGHLKGDGGWGGGAANP